MPGSEPSAPSQLVRMLGSSASSAGARTGAAQAKSMDPDQEVDPGLPPEELSRSDKASPGDANTQLIPAGRAKASRLTMSDDDSSEEKEPVLAGRSDSTPSTDESEHPASRPKPYVLVREPGAQGLMPRYSSGEEGLAFYADVQAEAPARRSKSAKSRKTRFKSASKAGTTSKRMKAASAARNNAVSTKKTAKEATSGVKKASRSARDGGEAGRASGSPDAQSTPVRRPMLGPAGEPAMARQLRDLAKASSLFEVWMDPRSQSRAPLGPARPSQVESSVLVTRVTDTMKRLCQKGYHWMQLYEANPLSVPNSVDLSLYDIDLSKLSHLQKLAVTQSALYQAGYSTVNLVQAHQSRQRIVSDCAKVHMDMYILMRYLQAEVKEWARVTRVCIVNPCPEASFISHIQVVKPAEVIRPSVTQLPTPVAVPSARVDSVAMGSLPASDPSLEFSPIQRARLSVTGIINPTALREARSEMESSSGDDVMKGLSKLATSAHPRLAEMYTVTQPRQNDFYFHLPLVTDPSGYLPQGTQGMPPGQAYQPQFGAASAFNSSGPGWYTGSLSSPPHLPQGKVEMASVLDESVSATQPDARCVGLSVCGMSTNVMTSTQPAFAARASGAFTGPRPVVASRRATSVPASFAFPSSDVQAPNFILPKVSQPTVASSQLMVAPSHPTPAPSQPTFMSSQQMQAMSQAMQAQATFTPRQPEPAALVISSQVSVAPAEHMEQAGSKSAMKSGRIPTWIMEANSAIKSLDWKAKPSNEAGRGTSDDAEAGSARGSSDMTSIQPSHRQVDMAMSVGHRQGDAYKWAENARVRIKDPCRMPHSVHPRSCSTLVEMNRPAVSPHSVAVAASSFRADWVPMKPFPAPEASVRSSPTQRTRRPVHRAIDPAAMLDPHLHDGHWSEDYVPQGHFKLATSRDPKSTSATPAVNQPVIAAGQPTTFPVQPAPCVIMTKKPSFQMLSMYLVTHPASYLQPGYGGIAVHQLYESQFEAADVWNSSGPSSLASIGSIAMPVGSSFQLKQKSPARSGGLFASSGISVDASQIQHPRPDPDPVLVIRCDGNSATKPDLAQPSRKGGREYQESDPASSNCMPYLNGHLVQLIQEEAGLVNKIAADRVVESAGIVYCLDSSSQPCPDEDQLRPVELVSMCQVVRHKRNEDLREDDQDKGVNECSNTSIQRGSCRGVIRSSDLSPGNAMQEYPFTVAYMDFFGTPPLSTQGTFHVPFQFALAVYVMSKRTASQSDPDAQGFHTSRRLEANSLFGYGNPCIGIGHNDYYSGNRSRVRFSALETGGEANRSD